MPVKATRKDGDIILMLSNFSGAIPHIVELERVQLIVASQRQTGKILSDFIREFKIRLAMAKGHNGQKLYDDEAFHFISLKTKQSKKVRENWFSGVAYLEIDW